MVLEMLKQSLLLHYLAAQSGSFGTAAGSIFFGAAGGTKYYKDISATNSQGLISDDYTSSFNLLKNKDQYALM